MASSSGFAKIHATILDSSIWDESAETRIVWITMLAMANADGIVEASTGGLARRACVSKAACKIALDVFLSPDEDSRDGTTGERIEKITGGWFILNHANYRDKRTKQQVDGAERARRHREKLRVTRNASNAASRGITAGNDGSPQKQKQKQKTHTQAQAPDPGVTLVKKTKLYSSLASVPHPSDPTKTYNSAQYVIEAFRAMARTIGQDITPSAIRHKERAALELIERLALESIEGVEVGRELAFAKVVNQRMGRYRDEHRESPQRLPWKASWIAERWPALGAAA